MKLKPMYGHDLRVGMRVKDWEGAMIQSIDPIAPPPNVVITFDTDKGKYCCGMLALLAVYEDSCCV